MGARADGWWRDRAGAALRLGLEVMALAARPGEAPASAWVLVLEGQAREAAALLQEALSQEEALPQNQAALPHNQETGAVPVRIVAAPGSGDDAIVGVVAETVARDETCLVVTADRELRQRCEDLNASVVGPGWLLRLL
jgi:8-oxo-dGTP diphosphatase